MAIAGKDKGEAQNEAAPIDVKSLLPWTHCHRFLRLRCDRGAGHGACRDHAPQPGARAAVPDRFAAGGRPVMFFTLGAPFAAALEVIVYAGAIMVLFVFVVMMLNLGDAAVRAGTQLAASRASGSARQLLAGAAAGRTAVLLFAQPGSAISGQRKSAPRPSASRCSGPTCWRSSWPRCCCSAGWSRRFTSRGGRTSNDGDPAGARPDAVPACCSALGLLGLLVRRNITLHADVVWRSC